MTATHETAFLALTRMPCCRLQDDHAGALREAQLLDSLDHPNIIRYRESFVDTDGSLCIVTSFCEEGDLFTRIRKKAAAKEYFTEEEVMNMFVQVSPACSGVQHAEQQAATLHANHMLESEGHACAKWSSTMTPVHYPAARCCRLLLPLRTSTPSASCTATSKRKTSSLRRVASQSWGTLASARWVLSEAFQSAQRRMDLQARPAR
jgi:hypothetical protein